MTYILCSLFILFEYCVTVGLVNFVLLYNYLFHNAHFYSLLFTENFMNNFLCVTMLEENAVFFLSAKFTLHFLLCRLYVIMPS